MSQIQSIILNNPRKVVFGNSAFAQFVADFRKLNYKRLFVLTISELSEFVTDRLSALKGKNIIFEVNTEIKAEPSFEDFNAVLKNARDFKADSIVGIGGGSVLDTAKLIAAFVDNRVELREFISDNSKLTRNIFLVCLPTTSGTGSEMSPNAIFFDPDSDLKIGVISPALLPDASYIDPELTVGVPSSVTASTGLDALTHCIEAYVNKFAHPVIDLLALEGIALIGKNLKDAFRNGKNLAAREKVALGSVYGGMCLGPVNTGAVHALAYPLGSTYKIAHGVSNALLLPHVMEYNLKEAVGKYAKVARAFGVGMNLSDEEAAREGIRFIRDMIRDFSIPARLSDLNISESEIEKMAESALKIQRLLKNNVRPVLLDDAIDIYRKAK